MDAIKTNHTIVMPLRHYTSPKFKWTDSAQTDVTRTWRKARLLLRLNSNAYNRIKHIHAVDKGES